MKAFFKVVALAGITLLGAQAIADDSVPAGQTSDKTQAIKACMERQKAKNSGMTQSAMETVCKNEAANNGKKDGNDLATGPQPTKPQT